MIRTTLTTTVICAFFTPPSRVTPISASINRCLMPATKWNANADNNPQAMNLAKKLLANALLTASKPAGDDSDLPSAQKAKIRPTKRMTPVIRCVIDVSAGSGKCIVVRSKFTGRLLFTALYTLSWPALRQVGHGPSGHDHLPAGRAPWIIRTFAPADKPNSSLTRLWCKKIEVNLSRFCVAAWL